MVELPSMLLEKLSQHDVVHFCLDCVDLLGPYAVILKDDFLESFDDIISAVDEMVHRWDHPLPEKDLILDAHLAILKELEYGKLNTHSAANKVGLKLD